MLVLYPEVGSKLRMLGDKAQVNRPMIHCIQLCLCIMVMAPEYALDDLVHFCTSPFCFSILGVDPTFNLGEFDVTVTTYCHLLLQHHRELEGKPPVMFGPMFVYVKKDFSTYHFFASSLNDKAENLTLRKRFHRLRTRPFGRRSGS